jgi:hypothetical protein
MSPMDEGQSTNDVISRMCSDLADLRALAGEQGETAALDDIVATVQNGGDLDAAAAALMELTKKLGAPSFATTARRSTTISGISDGHPVDETWICPADPPTCTRVELPVAGITPACSLHAQEMRQLRLDQ